MSNIDAFVKEVFSDAYKCDYALNLFDRDRNYFDDVCKLHRIEMELIDMHSDDDLEDDGSTWTVYRLSYNNAQEVKFIKFIKFVGYYSSFVGVDYHTHTYVKPKLVKHMQWE